MAKGRRRGSIRRHKTKGRYEARITIGYRGDGTPIQRSKYADTEEGAEKALTDLLSKHDRGMLADPTLMTVAECVERYIAGKVNADEGTLYKARTEVKLLLDIIGRKRVQDLRPNHVRDAYTALARQQLSIRAQRRAAMHLKAALREAVNEDIVYRNVAEPVKVSVPRVDEEDEGAQAWTREEVQLFLQAARGELKKKAVGGKQAKGKEPEWVRVPPEKAEPVELYAMYYLMLTLGLRRGEALGLRWQDVDLGEGRLRVRQSLSPQGQGGGYVIKQVKTSSSRRTLYLRDDLVSVLRAHKARQDEQKKLLRSDWQEIDLVFTTAIGHPGEPTQRAEGLQGALKGTEGHSDPDPRPKAHARLADA